MASKKSRNHMTRGGWGEVKVAEFRGVRVAAKVLFRGMDTEKVILMELMPTSL